MEEFKYDTYCGLYCGACDIMAAFKKSTVENTKPQWEDLPVEFRKNIPAGKAAEIICYGCKSDTVFIGCSKCLIRNCAKEKMQVETCFDCGKFPCLKFRVFGFIRKLMEKKLPHLKSAHRNQLTIQEKGLAVWLHQQEALWKCPQCRTDFTWYSQTCPKCGNELESVKDFRLI